jgi:hypothetical protein
MNISKPLLLLLITSFFSTANAENCHSVYDFHSLSKIKSSVQGISKQQDIVISLSLYLKKMNKKKKDDPYTRLLGVVKNLKVENKDDKNKIIVNTMREIFSYPFILSLDKNNNLQAIDVPPDNRKYISSVIGLVQNIFVPKKEGEYFELTAEGLAKVNYYIKDNKIHKKRLGIYNEKKEKNEDFHFPASDFTLVADKQDCLRVGVIGHEKYKIISDIGKSRATAYLELKVKYNKVKTGFSSQVLSNINTDMNQWRMSETKTPKQLTQKKQETLARYLSDNLNLLKKRKEKLALINSHLDFLTDLNFLLKQGLLEDKAIMDIMWGLGVIDNRQSVHILNNIIVDRELTEQNRFRALRGLAMTKTSLSPQEVNQLTMYLDKKYRISDVDSSIAMVLGELAANRLRTDPEQTALIERSIVEHIETSAFSGKPDRIVLNAARNMQEAASDVVVDAIVNVLNYDSNKVKATAADALAQFSKRSYLVPIINKQLATEKKPKVLANFINAYTKHGSDSVNFASKMKNYAMDRQQHGTIREAAVNGLLTSGYGKNTREKNDLKEIIVNEKNPSIIRSLSTVVYAPEKPKRTSNLLQYD